MSKWYCLKCRDEVVPMNEINRPLICSLLIHEIYFLLITRDFQSEIKICELTGFQWSIVKVMEFLNNAPKPYGQGKDSSHHRWPPTLMRKSISLLLKHTLLMRFPWWASLNGHSLWTNSSKSNSCSWDSLARDACALGNNPWYSPPIQTSWDKRFERKWAPR